MLENRRSNLAKAVNNIDETEIMLRNQKYIQTYKNHINQFCNCEGYHRSNIMHKQRTGLKNLKQRVKNKSVVICKADKTDKLCAMTPEMYVRLRKVHHFSYRIATA